MDVVGYASNDKVEGEEEVQVDFTIRVAERRRWKFQERVIGEDTESEVIYMYQLPTPDVLLSLNTTCESYILGVISSSRLPEKANDEATQIAFAFSKYVDIAMSSLIKKTMVSAYVELVDDFIWSNPVEVTPHDHQTLCLSWYFEEELAYHSSMADPFVIDQSEEPEMEAMVELENLESSIAVPFDIDELRELVVQAMVESEESETEAMVLVDLEPWVTAGLEESTVQSEWEELETPESYEWEDQPMEIEHMAAEESEYFVLDDNALGESESGQEIEDLASNESEDLDLALEESAQEVEFRAEPVTEAGIEALVIEKYQRGTFNETCSVCMECFVAGEEVTLIPCKHAYHWSCIMEWLARSNACPLCRFKLP
ncbi:E3 ubiquitin-protein ligase RNF6-like protein [Cinnamomum micranthum f. kanehirae]|uniref:E3 ubiquitin-protein ligase RNF6-like protein n=1 Tax=Cinnamomum micranthum f. kanehirae TaxID=337451 RepID=A0A443N6F5_9MAGN|nr:E3 ubiquitin-protein ligase RNF6-like protein [Cinnamomum micranthum f. kanehirae]